MTEKMKSLFFDLSEIAKDTDQIALLDSNDRVVTYRQLVDFVDRAHGWLNSMGLKSGDALIALLPNSIETIILFLASLRAGLVYAPLPCTATLSEITRWKKRVNANFCLLANPVSGTLQDQISNLNWRVEVVRIGFELNWPECEKKEVEKTGTLVMPSSGSTGEPKAILLSVDHLWNSAKTFLNYHQVERSVIRFWNYLPMSYLGGLFNLTLIPLVAGGSVFVDDAFNGKTFLGFWSTIARHNINSIWLVPSILRGLLALSNRIGQNRVYPPIRHCFLGTAPIFLEEKQKFFEVFGIQPLENYGLSETTFISSEKMNHLDSRCQNSVGNKMPHVEIKLKPANDPEKREMTEIWVKTPYLMLCYLDEKGVTNPLLDDQGFMPTGDFGEIVNNQLLVTGRRRDIIKKGGILILLREIEHLVGNYPKVSEAAAVKIDHPFYGESFNLYVCLEKSVIDCAKFQKELTNWIHKQLAQDKWPEKIFLRRDFPRTNTGKIQKHLLETRTVAHAE